MRSIAPVTQFEKEFRLPGDKSITHRAVMLNASADGASVVSGASLGGDCLSTCACMRALGAKIDVDGTTLFLHGTSHFHSGRTLDCGNSATTMRLLTGLLAGKGIEATLVGDASLSMRPMMRIIRPLGLLGGKVLSENGCAPLHVTPSMLRGREIVTDVSSAQVKSALLLAGLSAKGKTTVVEPIQSRDHTEKLLAAMGASVCVQGTRVSVEKGNLTPINVEVPADFSSAAYAMALGVLKGKTLCKGVCVNPTRTGFLTALQEMSARVSLQNVHTTGGEDVADILVEQSPLRAIQIGGERIPSMIDELPLLALLCAFADGESVISGAKELRVKECDRIKATAAVITALGGDCVETEDGWRIRGKKALLGGRVDSLGDHRIAMMAAVGLMASMRGGELVHDECVAVSFPNFFEEFGL